MELVFFFFIVLAFVIWFGMWLEPDADEYDVPDWVQDGRDN